MLEIIVPQCGKFSRREPDDYVIATGTIPIKQFINLTAKLNMKILERQSINEKAYDIMKATIE